jgi:hypothetical protein
MDTSSAGSRVSSAIVWPAGKAEPWRLDCRLSPQRPRRRPSHAAARCCCRCPALLGGSEARLGPSSQASGSNSTPCSTMAAGKVPTSLQHVPPHLPIQANDEGLPSPSPRSSRPSEAASAISRASRACLVCRLVSSPDSKGHSMPMCLAITGHELLFVS